MGKWRLCSSLRYSQPGVDSYRHKGKNCKKLEKVNTPHYRAYVMKEARGLRDETAADLVDSVVNEPLDMEALEDDVDVQRSLAKFPMEGVGHVDRGYFEGGDAFRPERLEEAVEFLRLAASTIQMIRWALRSSRSSRTCEPCGS